MRTQSQVAEFANTLRIATPRLVIRRFTSEHVDAETEQSGLPEVMRFIREVQDHQERHTRAISFCEPWDAAEGRWQIFPVDLTERQETLGFLTLRIESYEFARAEIGFRFHPRYHRQGYGLEACLAFFDQLFKQLELRKLLGYCVASNDASSGLMRRLGMQEEALLRAHSSIAGEWHDERIFGLFAHELRQG